MALAFLCKKQPTIIRCTGGNTNAFCNTYLVAWLRRNLLLPDCFVGTCNFWWYFLCLAWLILASLVLLGCSPGLALFACFAALASSCFFGKSWAVTVQWKSCFASCFKIPSRKVDSPARPLPSLFHVEATGKQEDTVERKTTGNTKGSKSKHPKNPHCFTRYSNSTGLGRFFEWPKSSTNVPNNGRVLCSSRVTFLWVDATKQVGWLLDPVALLLRIPRAVTALLPLGWDVGTSKHVGSDPPWVALFVGCTVATLHLLHWPQCSTLCTFPCFPVKLGCGCPKKPAASTNRG